MHVRDVTHRTLKEIGKGPQKETRIYIIYGTWYLGRSCRWVFTSPATCLTRTAHLHLHLHSQIHLKQNLSKLQQQKYIYHRQRKHIFLSYKLEVSLVGNSVGWEWAVQAVAYQNCYRRKRKKEAKNTATRKRPTRMPYPTWGAFLHMVVLCDILVQIPTPNFNSFFFFSFQKHKNKAKP